MESKFKFEFELINNFLNRFFKNTISDVDFQKYINSINKNKMPDIFYIIEYILNFLKNFKIENYYEILVNKLDKLKFKDEKNRLLINWFIYCIELKFNKEAGFNFLRKFLKTYDNLKLKKDNHLFIFIFIELLIKYDIVEKEINNDLKNIFENKFRIKYKINHDFDKIKNKIIETKQKITLKNKEIYTNGNNRKSNFYNNFIKNNITSKVEKVLCVRKSEENNQENNIVDDFDKKNKRKTKYFQLEKKRKSQKKTYPRNMRQSHNIIVMEKKNTFHNQNNLIHINNIIQNINQKKSEFKDIDDNKSIMSNNLSNILLKSDYYNESKTKYSVCNNDNLYFNLN